MDISSPHPLLSRFLLIFTGRLPVIVSFRLPVGRLLTARLIPALASFRPHETFSIKTD
jgi:hypothetical protein